VLEDHHPVPEPIDRDPGDLVADGQLIAMALGHVSHRDRWLVLCRIRHRATVAQASLVRRASGAKAERTILDRALQTLELDG
jgi:hypothetical protein